MNATFSCHRAAVPPVTARSALFARPPCNASTAKRAGGAARPFLLAALLAWLAPLDAALAACSTHRGKVVFNEVYRPASGAGGFVELKILNASVAAATTSFTGWKLDVYSTNTGTRTSADFHALFINNALNTCGTGSLWIKVPDTAIGNYLSSKSLPYNLVLSDSAGEIVDILRLGTSPASFYGAGANYPACPNIESALPDARYDAVVSSRGPRQRDWYRDPDGSGTWTGSSTSNVFNTVCASNGGAAASGAFTAYDPTSPACTGPSGNIRTKVAGASFNLDIVALNAARTAVDTSFAGAVKVEVLRINGSSPALDANQCPSGAAVEATFIALLASGCAANTAIPAIPEAWRYAKLRISYPPAGSATVVSCSGDAFAVRPASIAAAVRHIDWITAGDTTDLMNGSTSGTPIHKAGRNFTLKGTGYNAANIATANYNGLPTLVAGSPTLLQGAVLGTFTPGAFSASGGTVWSNAARYSEAGALRIALEDRDFAQVDSGDGSPNWIVAWPALTAGRFVPDHFDTAVSAACGSFSYSGQPLPLTITARNAGGAATQNYAGNLGLAKPVTLSAANGVAGTFSLNPLAASVFAGGVADLTTPPSVGFTFSSPLTAPAAVQVRATDSDAVSSADGSPVVEGGSMLRSGRLRLLNTYGSELLPIRVPVRSEFYTGTGWSINTADNCTALPATAFFVSNVAGAAPVIAAATPNPLTLTNGQATLVFNPANTAGRFDLAANLNAAGPDTSCNAAHGGTAANLPWLQGFWSSTCNGTPPWRQDPNARIQLGAPRAPYIYLRERY